MESARRIQHRVREFANAVKGIATQPMFEQADLVEVGGAIVRALDPVCRSRGIELRFENECDTLTACIDPERIYNALYNLVDNAASEIGEGGWIKLGITVENGSKLDGKVVVLSVSDNGPGIPEKVRSRLFTEHVISTKPGGTGLGTRIVKNVVDSHGGCISVSSSPGAGAIFTIELPLSRK
jgi:signal transduction histidine kinase